MSQWTTTRIAQVTRLWNEGLSAGQISKEINATRNAVMGVIHRQNLPHRTTRMRVPPPHLSADQKAHRQKEKAFAIANGWRAPIFRDPAPIPITTIPLEFLGITLLDLKDAECRFPRGEGANILFCGQPTMRGESWCDDCHKIVFNKPTSLTGRVNYAIRRAA
jgi:hypothetical protein